VGRGIALLFLDLGARRGWVVFKRVYYMLAGKFSTVYHLV
jgi:hypothetical protein